MIAIVALVCCLVVPMALAAVAFLTEMITEGQKASIRSRLLRLRSWASNSYVGK